MSNMQERLDAAVNLAEVDSSIFHKIIHGTDSETVETESGNVSTIAKAIKDVVASISLGATDIIGIANSTLEKAKEQVLMATEKALECSQSEDNSKISEGNARLWAEGSDDEVEALGGVHSAREWCERAQNNVMGIYPYTSSGVATQNQTLLPLPNKLLLNSQILNVVVENTILLPQNYKLSEDKNSVELLNPLSSGERWCVCFLQDLQKVLSLTSNVFYEDM